MSPNRGYELNYEDSREGGKGNIPLSLYPLLSFDVMFGISIGFGGILFSQYTSPIGILELMGRAAVLIVIALVILLVIHFFQRRRHRAPVEIPEFRVLLDHAAKRIGYEDDIEVWTCEQTTVVLAGLATFLSRAIVVSESAVKDILAKPLEGEVVLARAVANLRTNHFMSTWIPITLFVGGQLLASWAFLTPLSLKISLAFLAIAAMSCLSIWSEIRGPRSKGDSILQEYGLHPDEARIWVFRGMPPRPDEALNIRRGEEDSESASAPTGKKIEYIAASLVIAAAVSYLLHVLVFLGKTPSNLVELGIDVLVPLLVFFITFEIGMVLFSRRVKSRYRMQVWHGESSHPS